jgi:hypothetical protein
MGGGLDINLVAQLATINIGPFRSLERRAVDSPGSLYFTYWAYRPEYQSGAVAAGVDQGLLSPGELPDIAPHIN